MKLMIELHVRMPTVSHPAGVRGLKHHQQAQKPVEALVAPRRGAWIETSNWLNKQSLMPCRTPQGCVD